MGSPKPLLPLGERTVIDQVLDIVAVAGVAEIVLVLGPSGEIVAETIRQRAVRIVWNRADESDMADSLRAGLAGLPPAVESLLVFLPDHPLVLPQTVRLLLSEQARRPDLILLPTHAGRRGHPILLPRAILAELAHLPTLRDVIRRDPDRVREVATDDPGILQDMDTPEEYRQVLAEWERRTQREERVGSAAKR